MTGELKDEMCGRSNCEICQLLNELFAEPRLKSEVNLIFGKFDKYARLFNH